MLSWSHCSSSQCCVLQGPAACMPALPFHSRSGTLSRQADMKAKRARVRNAEQQARNKEAQHRYRSQPPPHTLAVF